MLGKGGEVNLSVNVACLSHGHVLQRFRVRASFDDPGKACGGKSILNLPVLDIVIDKSRNMFCRGAGDSPRGKGTLCYFSGSKGN